MYFTHYFTRLPLALTVGIALCGAISLTGCGGGGAPGSGSGTTPFSLPSAATQSAAPAVVTTAAPFAVTAPAPVAPVSKSVTLSCGASGTRGYLPVMIQAGSNAPTTYQALDGNNGVTLTTDSTTSIQVSAPATYADRQFVAWQQGTQQVSTNPVLTVTPASLTGTGPLVAVYASAVSTAGAFTPNFSRPNFPSWAHFPVRVYLDSSVIPGSTKDTSIRNGLNRWVSATGGLVAYEIARDAAQSDVQIGFGATPAGLAALTNAAWDGNNHMTSAQVTLNPPVLGQNQTTTQNLDTIMAHEFGHVLGLIAENDPTAGHSSDANDTMFPTGNSQVGLITQRDIDTIAGNYLGLFTGARSVPMGVSGFGDKAPAVHHATIF